MAEIRFEHVSKYYGKVLALNDLNLTIHDREFLTLVGPSGCGKSTTLNILAGLEDPSAGLIYIDDRIINEVPSGTRDIAMVFQSYALYPHMSVRDNIGFGLRVRRMPPDEIRKRVDEAARILDIADLLDRKPRQLSGGQRQRVALGRAITRDPKVFLLDEPLSNLDAQLRVQMRTELKLLFNRLQGTVVYVTHDQAEAMTLSDRIVVMRGGLVQQVGTPLEVYNQPSNIFVAGFLGSPGMNFVHCELGMDGDRVKLVTPGFTWSLDGKFGAALKQANARKVILGVRPEDLKVSAQPIEPGIPCKVDVLEYMGAFNIISVSAGSDHLLAITDPAFRVNPGETVWLSIAPEKTHLFDQTSEANLVVKS